jgi:hypothetical protein
LKHIFASPGLHMTTEAEQNADINTDQGLRRASVGRKSSEPLLLTEAYQLQKDRDLMGDTARKKPSEALLVEAREPLLPTNMSAVAPGSHEMSTPQEMGVEARTVSSGKRLPPPARKPKGR